MTSFMTAWTNKYFEALCLDMSILSLLIDRNRKQHYRASYFRRLDMLIRCMKRYNVLVDPGESNTSFIIDIFESIKSETDRIASILERCKSLQKRRGIQQEKVQDECWSLLSTDGQKESDLQPPFLQNMILLHASINQHLPEVLSRIMFAAASLYTELSRGYFAPLCTVALGCISRIRVLLLQFGRDAVLQYHKTMGLLEAEFLVVVLKGGQLEQHTGLSVESVKAFTAQYKLDLDFMNNFIDTNHYEHAAKIKQWKLEKIMQRGESNVSSRSELTKDVQSNASESASETQRPDQTDDHELQDIIGELIETNNDEKSSGLESIEQLAFMAEKDDGDRNLELVKLVKEQRKKDKPTKRKATKVLDMEGRLSKLPKVSERELPEDKGISSEWKEEIKSSKEKKSKTKKKKKKRSKDVIDAIFDQL